MKQTVLMPRRRMAGIEAEPKELLRPVPPVSDVCPPPQHSLCITQYLEHCSETRAPHCQCVEVGSGLGK